MTNDTERQGDIANLIRQCWPDEYQILGRKVVEELAVGGELAPPHGVQRLPIVETAAVVAAAASVGSFLIAALERREGRITATDVREILEQVRHEERVRSRLDDARISSLVEATISLRKKWNI